MEVKQKTMREILFRGKSKINGEWVYGFYSGENCSEIFSPMFKQDNIIIKGSGFWVEVEAETVGEYTGLTDANCVRIFEGDIICTHDTASKGKKIGVIKFGKHPASNVESLGFYIDWKNDDITRNDLLFWTNLRKIEVVGNIHDNPELLGDKGT